MLSTPHSNASLTAQQSQGIIQKTMDSHLLSELPLNSNTLLFGLNFKYTEVDKKGFLNRIRGKKQAIDLDLSCLLFDKGLKVVDIVWFKQLRDRSEAIRHQGDSLNGKDRGDLAQIDRNADVETIELSLTNLPINVAHIALIVSSYHGQLLKKVQRGHLYISDDEGNEVHNVDLTLLKNDSSAMLVATISRELSEWRLTFNNLTLESYQMEDMVKQAQKELSRLYTATYR